MSDGETEALRQEYLAELEGDFEADQFKPGSFGCHEALHMAAFLEEAVDRQLLAHPAVLANPEWFKLAATAERALADLYQAIGAAHVEER